MSTTVITGVEGNPEIPLTPDLRTAYEELYAQYETAIENTTDPALLEKLNASQLAVAAVINADNQAILNRNTDTFSNLLTQIGIANKGLRQLQADIEKIGKNIGMYAGIVTGIVKVLGMVPGI